MKRLLLTGLGGGIGIHTFAHIMHNTDWHVVGIDSFRHKGMTDRITYMLGQHPEWRDRLTMFTHDLTAPFSPVLLKQIGNIDYIINMASLSDVENSIHNAMPFYRNNTELVMNVVEAARELKPDVFIQISTDEVYGPTQNKEDIGAKEWDPVVPSNTYAASKASQEAYCIAAWRQWNLPLIITNTMNNYGELQSPSKYPSMVIRKLLKGEKVEVHGTKHEDGTAEIGSRSYIHSRNFSDALLFLIKNHPPHMHVPDAVDMPDKYHIAGDVKLDNLELAQLIAKLMGKRDVKFDIVNVHTQRPGHDRHYGLDDSKIRDLGWQPPVGFEDSLKETIEFYIENPEWL
jgi:dTDP-glucose 4,6-dehydratase